MVSYHRTLCSLDLCLPGECCGQSSGDADVSWQFKCRLSDCYIERKTAGREQHTLPGGSATHVYYKKNQCTVLYTSQVWVVWKSNTPSPSCPCVSQVSSSFPGCLHSVSLNGVTLDLFKPSTRHHVSSCFTSDQPGSYFNGSGYAILSTSKRKQRWINSITIQLMRYDLLGSASIFTTIALYVINIVISFCHSLHV